MFKKLGKVPCATDCPAIDGIIKEAKETASEIDDKAVLDAAIVANSQAVEHYEIARYGTVIACKKAVHDALGAERLSRMTLGDPATTGARPATIGRAPPVRDSDREMP